MQLQYAYILQQLLPLMCYHTSETAWLELETGIVINGTIKEIDLLLIGHIEEKTEGREYKIAVEMKYYKTLASSGGKRGATDIFMKDVYEDLRLLELYCDKGTVNQGVSLVMNELERLVNPKKKTAKCWDYDISQGTKIRDITLNTPIGGKDIHIHLRKAYKFMWQRYGKYWFMELEGGEEA